MLEFILFSGRENLYSMAADAGIDRIVIDLEIRGKKERQHGYHLEQNYLTVRDVEKAKEKFPSVVACRINPVNSDSRQEIDDVLNAGADQLILPMFKTEEEVSIFLDAVGDRAKTILLFETVESVAMAESLKSYMFNEVYVGLNDLSISANLKFAFEALTEGYVDKVREAFPLKPFGFGAITVLGLGKPVPSKMVLTEMARLKSDFVILRRAFIRDSAGLDWNEEIGRIRGEYSKLMKREPLEIEKDHSMFVEKIREIAA